MMIVTVTSNLSQAKDSWSTARLKFLEEVKSFLPKRQPKILKHTQEIVQATVYDVYEPMVYERTNHFYESMYVRQPGQSPYELEISSDPAIAKAVADSGGYGKYIAGEGPGIGFLQPFYGVGEDVRPSYFPRRFHDHIVMLGSSVYRNLEEDLNRDMMELVNRWF